jgi:hypothetical protein
MMIYHSESISELKLRINIYPINVILKPLFLLFIKEKISLSSLLIFRKDRKKTFIDVALIQYFKCIIR